MRIFKSCEDSILGNHIKETTSDWTNVSSLSSFDALDVNFFTV